MGWLQGIRSAHLIGITSDVGRQNLITSGLANMFHVSQTDVQAERMSTERVSPPKPSIVGIGLVTQLHQQVALHINCCTQVTDSIPHAFKLLQMQDSLSNILNGGKATCVIDPLESDHTWFEQG